MTLLAGLLLTSVLLLVTTLRYCLCQRKEARLQPNVVGAPGVLLRLPGPRTEPAIMEQLARRTLQQAPGLPLPQAGPSVLERSPVTPVTPGAVIHHV